MKYIAYPSAKPPGLLQKTAAVITTVGLIGVGLMFSAVLLPIILAIVAAAWAWLWWKTRDVRKQMKQMQAGMQNFQMPGANMERDVFKGEVFEGEVIEGEATRVDDQGRR